MEKKGEKKEKKGERASGKGIALLLLLLSSLPFPSILGVAG